MVFRVIIQLSDDALQLLSLHPLIRYYDPLQYSLLQIWVHTQTEQAPLHYVLFLMEYLIYKIRFRNHA